MRLTLNSNVVAPARIGTDAEASATDPPGPSELQTHTSIHDQPVIS